MHHNCVAAGLEVGTVDVYRFDHPQISGWISPKRAIEREGAASQT